MFRGGLSRDCYNFGESIRLGTKNEIVIVIIRNLIPQTKTDGCIIILMTRAPSWLTLLQINYLELFGFVMIFVTSIRMNPPADFVCCVAATGVSLFARQSVKEFAL